MTLSVQAQEGKKKIADNVFVPKGQWIVGSSVSYSEHTEENYQFLIIDKFNSDGYSFKVSPLVVYGLKDNLAMGGRFSFNFYLYCPILLLSLQSLVLFHPPF